MTRLLTWTYQLLVLSAVGLYLGWEFWMAATNGGVR